MDLRLRQLEREAQDDPLKQEAFIRSCYQSNQLPQDFQKLKWEYDFRNKEGLRLKEEQYKQEIDFTFRVIEDTLKAVPNIYGIGLLINMDEDRGWGSCICSSYTASLWVLMSEDNAIPIDEYSNEVDSQAEHELNPVHSKRITFLESVFAIAQEAFVYFYEHKHLQEMSMCKIHDNKLYLFHKKSLFPKELGSTLVSKDWIVDGPARELKF